MAPKLKPHKYKWIDRNIFARGTAKGVVYGISYTVEGRRRLETVGPTVTLARRALAVRKAEMAQGTYRLKSSRRQPIFQTFAGQYLNQYSKPNKRSWMRDEWALKKAVEFFGLKRLNEITTWDIERYRADRLESVSIATANRDMALLKHLFGRAVEWGLLAKSPATSIKLGREHEKPFRILSDDEERRLLDASADHLKPIIIVALNTGLRRMELLRLDWRDVDLKKHELTVRTSKAGKVRTIPLNAEGLAALSSLPGREGRVFQFEGRGISTVRRSFVSAVKRSGIRPIRLHDLRHSFASRLVMAGVDLPTVKELLGHSNFATTLRYSHPTPEHRRNAVGRIGSAAKVQREQRDA